MRTLVVIPAYEESANIVQTVRDVMSAGYERVLVVDDGSTDATAERAREAGAVTLRLPFNLGIGGAVQTGLLYAERHGYDLVVRIDADGQHRASDAAALCVPIVNDYTDMAIGSRFLQDEGYKSSLVRRLGIGFFAWLISSLTRSPVTDPTSGFQAFGRRAIRVFSRCYPSDFPEPESIMVAHRYGLTVCEVPVVMRERRCGLSSIRYIRTLYYMIKVSLAIILDTVKTRRRQEPAESGPSAG